VELLVGRAALAGAADLHIEPAATGAVVRHRVDGLLRDVQTLEPSAGRSAVAKLMVLAELLTYRLDVPQKGRASVLTPTGVIEVRVSVMPTTHGLRAAVRLPMRETAENTLRRLDGLGLPTQVAEVIKQFIRTSGGMLLLTGPAGSGKTTLVYALLSELATSGATSGGAECGVTARPGRARSSGSDAGAGATLR
jgi:type II secretory ATPase GspE/PulE/Tfp pilus assembly ATPase PilB-like protein